MQAAKDGSKLEDKMKYLTSNKNGLGVIEQLDAAILTDEPERVISDITRYTVGTHAAKLNRANAMKTADNIKSLIGCADLLDYDKDMLKRLYAQIKDICSEYLDCELISEGWRAKLISRTNTGKKKMLICFSGGRTSACMTDKLLEEYSDEYEFAVCFANTGWEHEETLRFVHKCDQRWGGVVVWLEAVTHQKKGIAPTHKIVNFESASRHLQPYHAMATKQGIPNAGYPHCTRDLKEYPIKSYLASIGWRLGRMEKGELVLPDYETAIGIRIDEPKRIKRNATVQNKIYPMVDMFPMDKIDVNNFWEQQPFNLEIPDYLGNCKGCFKKSQKKLYQAHMHSPLILHDAELMEKSLGHIGNNKIKGVNVTAPRTMYRNYMTGKLLAEEFDAVSFRRLDDQDESSCGESCNAFETDEYEEE